MASLTLLFVLAARRFLTVEQTLLDKPGFEEVWPYVFRYWPRGQPVSMQSFLEDVSFCGDARGIQSFNEEREEGARSWVI